MSSEIAIKVQNFSKCYQIYNQPHDRLKQSLYPRLQRLAGKQPTQYYREFWALKDVSFEIKKGETVGIIGRNGSGKSTLLQMICGTLNPTSGSIQTHGRIAALLELGSGFNPEFTGRENVYMNAAVLGLSKEETDARFDDIVAFADIADFIEQSVKTYSSGMVVRLAFAVAINVDPQILVVDEALAVGDELFQRKCFSRIQAIKDGGATVLFVSHSATHIIELCDRAILIDSGEKLVEGVPKFIVSQYQKLLYAPSDKRELIRQQSREEARLNIEVESSLAVVPDTPDPDDFYDSSLKPESTTKFDLSGAEIQAVDLFTVHGEKVNVLTRGRSYTYSYQVKFLQPAQKVRFHMAIRTISGLFLGGGFSASEFADSIRHVEMHQVINVNFSFTCHLNPGTYFMNAAVFGVIDRDEITMGRVVDALAFRVMPVSKDVSTGYMFFAVGVESKGA